MMNDEAVTSRFRVIAFDLPWHGKSYPPEGWQDEEYQLSTDLYVETVMAFCAALDLSRPALIGCSIGGRIALELAHRHSDRFRALIGVESADYQEPWYDTAWLHRPDVHGGEVCAALVSGLVAPQSPAVHRHETLWQYMQGGPGVFRGDLYFYRVDGDLRGRLGGIRTDICPLYLLTGEYDFSCSPDAAHRAVHTGSPGGGHARAGPFPHEREPGPVPALSAAAAGPDLRQARRGPGRSLAQET